MQYIRKPSTMLTIYPVIRPQFPNIFASLQPIQYNAPISDEPLLHIFFAVVVRHTYQRQNTLHRASDNSE